MELELRSPEGFSYPIQGEIVRLGRASDNQIVIKDPSVSRYHLNFFLKDGSLFVEDAGSQNGFILNGQRMNGLSPLKLGDTVSFGTKHYVVSTRGGPSVPAQAQPIPRQNPVMQSAPNWARPAQRSSPPRRALQAGPLKPLFFLIVGLVVLSVVFRQQELKTDKPPASSNISKPTAALSNEGYKPQAERQKSIGEVQSESKFRQALRDYNNGSFSRAMIGFREALTLNPANDLASEYLQMVDLELKKQLADLLKDGERSYANLQYQRAKSQSMRILSVMSEQVPGYGRKIAQDMSTSLNPKSFTQETNLLNVPCSRSTEPKACEKAIELLKDSRRMLGEEDALKNE